MVAVLRRIQRRASQGREYGGVASTQCDAPANSASGNMTNPSRSNPYLGTHTVSEFKYQRLHAGVKKENSIYVQPQRYAPLSCFFYICAFEETTHSFSEEFPGMFRNDLK